VFGEVYQNGTFNPSLNGTISGYSSSGGGHLGGFLVNSPYAISNSSGTGFTVSGPVVPEPCCLLLVGVVVLLGRGRGSSRRGGVKGWAMGRGKALEQL
jgi:hypothetical protein